MFDALTSHPPGVEALLGAVQTMVDHLKGKKVETYVDTGCALVTKENLESPDIKTLLQAP